MGQEISGEGALVWPADFLAVSVDVRSPQAVSRKKGTIKRERRREGERGRRDVRAAGGASTRSRSQRRTPNLWLNGIMGTKRTSVE
jgi:hypothetical protein